MKNTKGFTFVEMLIVLGIIALLAMATVVLLNPAKRFEAARDKQREIHLQAILSAIERKMTVEAGWFDEEKCDPLPQETKKEIVDEKEVEVAIFKTIGNKRDDIDSEKIHPDYYDLFECLVPKYMVNPLYDPDGGNEENTHYQIWQNPQTKYVTLRYVKEEPFKEIVAGAKKYGILSAPRHVETAGVTEIGHTTAKGGGTVYDDGGAYVFEAGVIWAKTADISDCETDLIFENVDMGTILRTIDGAGSATEGETSFNFDSNLHGLQGGVVDYCVRAYARNEIGVGYGGVVNFTTLDARPYVTTFAAENVTHDAAKLRGRVETMKEFPKVGEAYFCWWGPDITETCKVVKSNINAYPTPLEISYTLTGLTAGNIYHFKACATAIGVDGFNCGDIKEIEPKASAPFVETLSDVNVGSDWAEVGGDVISYGGEPIIRRGFCYHYYDNPCNFDPDYDSDWCVEATDGVLGETDNGQFFATLTELDPGRGYNVCAFAENTNNPGLSFGGSIPFSTIKTAPVLTTKTSTRGTTSPGSGVSGGIITTDGGELITQKGVCWSTSPSIPNKVTVDYCTNDGTGKNEFTSNIPVTKTGLWADKKYNVRAYAINDIDTGWADNVEEIDITDPVTPELTTIGPIEENTHTDSVENVGGNITDHGGAAIGLMGVCWNTKEDFTGEGDCQDVTPNVNLYEFYTDITGLFANTFYYLRAYAQNIKGTNYGDVESFRTKMSDPPEMEDGTTVIDTGEDWAKIGGEVKSNGGDPGTIRGVCYSGKGVQNPTYEIEDGTNVICDTDGTTGEEGLFEIEITGLAIRDASGDEITYYALAFAHNDAGSAYGYPAVSFEIGKKLGETCTGPDECKSGFCTDGFCCESECGGGCQVCNSQGACTTRPAGDNVECLPCGKCGGGISCTVLNKCDVGGCSGTVSCSGYATRLKMACDGQGTGAEHCKSLDECVSDCSGTCASWCKSVSGQGTCTNNDTSYGYCNVDTRLRVASGGNGQCSDSKCVAGGRYYLYVTNSEYRGNLGGRTGADAKCNYSATYSNKPTQCIGSAWAFISVNTTDQVINFPASKNVSRTLPWYWRNGYSYAMAANNFTDLILDGNGYIIQAANSVGYGTNYWTGSSGYSGELRYHCNNWTIYASGGGTYYEGTPGCYYKRDRQWLGSYGDGCETSNPILCACIARYQEKFLQN